MRLVLFCQVAIGFHMVGLRDECGVMGVMGDPEAANLIYLGLYALQHRGQEAAGIVTLDVSDGSTVMNCHKEFGLVGDGFNRETLDNLKGCLLYTSPSPRDRG